VPLGEQSKIISAKWQALSDNEKEKWRTLALHGVKEEDDTHTPAPAKVKPSLAEAFEKASSSDSPGKHCRR